MSDRILVLDQATKCTGFAEWVPGSMPTLGSQTYPQTGEEIGMFLFKYEEWLYSKFLRFEPTLVVFEVPWSGAKTHQDTARKLMSLAGFIEYICWKNKIRCRETKVSDWRRHFIGSGNLKRHVAHQRTKEACDRLGVHYRNQDEADAFGMLDYTAHLKGLQPDWGRSSYAAGELFRNGRAAE